MWKGFHWERCFFSWTFAVEKREKGRDTVAVSPFAFEYVKHGKGPALSVK